MSRRIIHTVVIIITIIGCTDQSARKDGATTKQKRISIQKTDSIVRSGDHKIYVSDTVRKIIDELNLCQYAENMNENVPNLFDCYDKDVSDIRLIKKGDTKYANFIFQSPGGSGGGTIIIYTMKNGKYEVVQDEYGYLIEVLNSTTKGYYDLIIWHRAQKSGGENILYKWNGVKYERVKEIKKEDYQK